MHVLYMYRFKFTSTEYVDERFNSILTYSAIYAYMNCEHGHSHD